MKKSKFSFIDVILILFLSAVVVFGIFKVKDGIQNAATEKNVKFAMLATDVNAGIKDAITIGDKVSISVKEKAFGTVVGVSETPHYEHEFSPNLGKYVSEIVEGKYDVMLEIECSANVSDTEILSNNVPIRVGEASYIHGKGYALEGYIVTVDKVD